MTGTRQNKVSRLLQKELGDILRLNGYKYVQGKMITVTVVRVSPDLGFAKTYLSIFPSNESNKALEAIRKGASEIRYELGKRVKNQLRIVPEITFYLDDSLDYIENINSLIR